MAFTERLAMLITANGAQAVGEFQKVGTAAERNLATAETRAARLGSTLTRVGVGLLTFGGVAAVGLYKAAQSASNLEQATGAVEAVLPGAAAGVQAWSETTADAFGLSERAAKESVAQIGAQLQGLGFSEAEAAAQAQLLTERGADLAATFGGPVDQAVQAIAATLRGERDPIERYGVSMKQADINARVMADGLDTSTVATKKASEAQAALSILMEQTAASQGQFGRESDTLAGQMAILSANGEEMAAAIGEQAAPAFADLMGAATAAMDVFGKLPEGVQSVISKFLVFGTAASLGVGALSLIGGQIAPLIAKFPALNTALDGTRLRLMMLSTVAKGALTAGFAAAAVGLAVYLNKQAEAQAMTDKYADALREVAAGNEEALNATAANTVATDSALNKYADFGLSATEVAAAIRDGGDALESVKAKMDALDDDGPVSEHMSARIKTFINDLEEEAGALDTARAETETASEATDGLAASAGGASEAVLSEAEAFSLLVEEIDAYLEQTFGVEDAQAAVAEAQQGLFESLVENGAAWDLNTEAGRANRDAGQEVVETTAGLISAISEQSGITLTGKEAQSQMNGVMAAAVGRLDAARAAGLITGQQYDTLKGQILGIPRTVNTNVITNVESVIGAYQRLVGVISNAGAAAAGASREFHNLPAGLAHGGYIRPGETRLTHSDEYITNTTGGPLKVTSQAATSSAQNQRGGTSGGSMSGRPVENVITLDGTVLARQLAPHLRTVERENA